MIQFKFRRLEIPPNYDVDHLGMYQECQYLPEDLNNVHNGNNQLKVG